MPREHKKRGRREEKKRKRQEEELALAMKRHKPEHPDNYEIAANKEYPNVLFNDHNPELLSKEMPFYGLLDEDEQEYFNRADSMLELNQFADDDERQLFLKSVYHEARGKELKIANSSSCSRLMERLIMMSTPNQLKELFQKFSGHFLYLAQHRFASHCCETLFIQAAPVVTHELRAPIPEQLQVGDGEVLVSMENLFLYALNELKENIGYLMTDPFASHTLRVLLVVFSGFPLSDTNITSLYQSKKKNKTSIFNQNCKRDEMGTVARIVPDSFRDAIDQIMSSFVRGLDTTYIQSLAIHPIANPVLQLLLEIELSDRGKSKAKQKNSLLQKLIPEGPQKEGAEVASFISKITYDAVGSHLMEIIIRLAPEKTFKKLYQINFYDKMQILAKDDKAGFVIIAILNRLSNEDLRYAVNQLCPQIHSLVERSRTSVVRTMIERCRIRGVETDSISDVLKTAYGSDPLQIVTNMLNLNSEDTRGMAEDRKKKIQNQNPERVHRSLLAQSMLQAPGALQDLIINSLLVMGQSTLIVMSKDQSSSRVLQSSLVCSDHTLKFRRILIPRFFGQIVNLATDSVASHVIDSIWTATIGLAFIRERVATELAENEAQLRDSFSGRVIWRNWKMDLYKSRRREWMLEAKVRGGDKRSRIELARERFANAQTRIKRKEQNYLTGAKGFCEIMSVTK